MKWGIASAVVSAVLGCCVVYPDAAVAHGAPIAAQSLPEWWRVDPLSALLLIGTAGCYARGAPVGRAAAPRAANTRRRILFWSGLAALAVALGPPLDALGGVLFSAHMLQHEMLMLVSAPLLVLSRPLGRLTRGLPRVARGVFRKCSRFVARRPMLRWLGSPPGAWTAHAVALWAWHLPFLFEASLTDDAVHAAQHGSFFLSALLFWQALLSGRGRAHVAVLYVFTTALHSGVLGALLTFAPTPWYPAYHATAPRFGISALEDQQLGGLIMWVPSGLVFLAAVLLLIARLLRPDRAATRWAYGRDARDGEG